MVTINDIIDHATGDIVWANVKAVALQAAKKLHGSDNPPAAYFNCELVRISDRAGSMRINWRQQRGLPDDSEMVVVNVSTWGNSGDSFAGGR